MSNEVFCDPVLPKLTAAINCNVNTGLVSVTAVLYKLQVAISGATESADVTGTIDALLPKLQANVSGGVPNELATIAIRLPKPKAHIISNIPTIVNYSALRPEVRVGGSVILQFLGPANVAVDWSVLSGGGTVTPLSDYTDPRGAAFARYTAGAVPEDVVVAVAYVP